MPPKVPQPPNNYSLAPPSPNDNKHKTNITDTRRFFWLLYNKYHKHLGILLATLVHINVFIQFVGILLPSGIEHTISPIHSVVVDDI